MSVADDRSVFVLECEFCGEQLLRRERFEGDYPELPEIAAAALLSHWNSSIRCARAVANNHGLRRTIDLAKPTPFPGT